MKVKELIKMLEADAMELDYPHEHFDAVTISFGLRNVKDADKCLAELGVHFTSILEHAP